MRVRCRCCHREEDRDGGAAVVRSPGGARRPDDPPERAAFAVLAGLGPREGVVGACPACGQPLVGDLPGGTWSFPAIDLVWDGAAAAPFRLAGAPVTPEEAERAVSERWPPPPPEPAALRAFQAAVLLLMVAPVLFWAFLFCFWFWYAGNLAASPWTVN